MTRWQGMRRIRDSVSLPGSRHPQLAEIARAPDIELHGIDVSFPALADKAEVEHLEDLPTPFALPLEAVDRLRAAAKTIIVPSPEFQELPTDAGAKLVLNPTLAAEKFAR